MGRMVTSNWFGAALATAWALFAAAGADTGSTSFSPLQIEFYEKQVQPILTENCFKCHSHQAEKIKGSFVLDSREGLLEGGDTGPAIVPGDPEKSLLIRAVRHVDEDLQMPPKKKLSDAQIALLAQWVKMGEPYSEVEGQKSEGRGQKSERATTKDRNWWSFQPVRAVQAPLVKDGGWSRNALDKFIFARL